MAFTIVGFPAKLPTKYVVPLILASVIGTAAATITLFTHTFPTVQLVAPPPAIITVCSTLAAEPPAPTEGVAGNVTFDCNLNPPTCSNAILHCPAFNFTGSGQPWIPIFTLPNNITSLSFSVPKSVGGVRDCQASDSEVILGLTSGVQPPLPPVPLGLSSLAGTPADYCAFYSATATGSLPSFTVTWTQ